MANTIRIKRRANGAGTGAPSSLQNAELAFNEQTNILYYGTGTGGANGTATSVIAIGGDGAFATKTYADTAAAALLSQSNTFQSGYTQTFAGTTNLSGTFQIGGVSVTSTAAEINRLAGVTAGTVAASKALVADASLNVNFGTGSVTAAGVSTGTLTTTGDAGVGGNLTVTGNLTVNGTTTTINSTAISVDDINVILGDTATPSDATADGGGLTLRGTTNKTLNWVLSTAAWTSSEDFNLVSGKSYEINGTAVLSSTALGSGVLSSSLTSVGTIGTGTWQGTAVGVAYGGTGATDAGTARTNLGLAIGTNVQAYDAELAAIAGLASEADRLPYFTGTGTAALATFSSFGRSLVDDADASAGRATLGLGTIATQSASNVNITGGSIDNITIDGGTF